MFLKMGIPITYMAFVIDHEGPYSYPEFDAAFWKAAEGPRRSFSHNPTKEK
jgi:tRNA (guanine-N7-)-methyltransferase